MESDKLQINGEWEQIARELWLERATAIDTRPEVITKRLWEPLEAESFQNRSLVVLETLHVLEQYLWPAYTEDATNQLVVLIAIFIGVKRRAQVPIWGRCKIIS